MFKRFLTNVAWLVGTQLVVAGLFYSRVVHPAREEGWMVAMAFYMVIVTGVAGLLLSSPRQFMAWIATGFMLGIILAVPFIDHIGSVQVLTSQPDGLAFLMLASCVVYDAVFIGMLLLFDREPMRRVADTS